MNIKLLSLFTSNLLEEKKFYTEKIGFDLIEESDVAFTIRVGKSFLTFVHSDVKHQYHYCFLIPSNKLQEALAWMRERTEIIDVENEGEIVHFDTWNAHSFYFYDASGNIAEFIVRHDLKNEQSTPFNVAQIISINELGLGSNRPAELNEQIEKEIGSKFWKGDLERFATNGSPEGMFLLPNYELKEVWFPTEIKIKPEPLHALIENNGQYFKVSYVDSKINIYSLSI